MYTQTYMNNVYARLATLTDANKRWLAHRLLEDTRRATRSRTMKNARGIEFPHVSKTVEVSPKVLGMVVGELPVGFDVDAELGKMWEERAE